MTTQPVTVEAAETRRLGRAMAALRRVAKDDGIAVVRSLHQVGDVSGFADRVLGRRQGRLVRDQPASGFDDRARSLVYSSPGVVE